MNLIHLMILGALNLRGSDNEQIPYFISYLLLNFNFDNDEVKFHGHLFIIEDKVDEKVRDYLKTLNIHVKPYVTVSEELGHIDKKIFINKLSCNAAVYGYLPNKSIVVNGSSIIEGIKVLILKIINSIL